MGRKFLSTSSARRTTIARIQVDHRAHISIHVLREEDDQRPAPILALSGISIHVLREEDDGRPSKKGLDWFKISIHVLREEDDADKREPAGDDRDISIHVLREEDDKLYNALRTHCNTFLSTSSARRTTRGFAVQRPPEGISIHVLREEDDSATSLSRSSRRISIHVLREEDDGIQAVAGNHFFIFLSTSSARRTTKKLLYPRFHGIYFYPRPPRGGRPAAFSRRPFLILFLSTSSARRTTRARDELARAGRISIHVLREEDDADTTTAS